MEYIKAKIMPKKLEMTELTDLDSNKMSGIIMKIDAISNLLSDKAIYSHIDLIDKVKKIIED